MRYVQVGLTHWQDAKADEASSNTLETSDKEDEFFFAPAHIQKRISALGADVFHVNSGSFVKEAMMWTASWLTVKNQRNIDSLASDFESICNGLVPASEGLVYSPR